MRIILNRCSIDIRIIRISCFASVSILYDIKRLLQTLINGKHIVKLIVDLLNRLGELK